MRIEVVWYSYKYGKPKFSIGYSWLLFPYEWVILHSYVELLEGIASNRLAFHEAYLQYKVSPSDITQKGGWVAGQIQQRPNISCPQCMATGTKKHRPQWTTGCQGSGFLDGPGSTLHHWQRGPKYEEELGTQHQTRVGRTVRALNFEDHSPSLTGSQWDLLVLWSIAVWRMWTV